jgi:hypothetical protein
MPARVDVTSVLARVDVTRVGVRIAHNAQDAGKTRLQHLDNNHLDARAKDPQAEMVRGGRTGRPGH